MENNIFKYHQELFKQLEFFCHTRLEYILNKLSEDDDTYNTLYQNRINASNALKEVIDSSYSYLIDEYMDAIKAHEIYQLDKVYKQAIFDIVLAIKRHE